MYFFLQAKYITYAVFYDVIFSPFFGRAISAVFAALPILISVFDVHLNLFECFEICTQLAKRLCRPSLALIFL